jgi:hypothetical protein
VRLAVAAAVCLLMLPACREPQEPAPAHPIHSLAEVWKLTPDQARRGYPVQVHGVVTFFDPQVELLTVQDETAGIYVATSGLSSNLSPGQAVDVRGFTGYEANAPVIVKPALRMGPGGKLPAPKRAEPRTIVEGQADYQWIETHGKLLPRTAVDGEHARHTLLLGGQAVECIVLTESGSTLDPLVGGEVAVRGVPVTIRAASGEIQRVQLYVASPEDMESRRAAAAPGESGQSPAEPDHATPGLPVLTTAAQIKSQTLRDDNRFYPVRMRAVVTLAEPDWSGLTGRHLRRDRGGAC